MFRGEAPEASGDDPALADPPGFTARVMPKGGNFVKAFPGENPRV